ncbi:probable uridine nucleosidase 2 [Caerostris extrusa]|uniref:Probable uridine nucleosidase 2 n=1 Tax=Caerostris extrusa TaxID=172846 RepID=A0AAV4XGQ4_CAEEX|nr:probable uridine nucleosidase 2 [Caerostris extrusa]
MGSVEKLVIDTDCGVDDAMAIMLALSSNKRCDVIGITCTFGNTPLDNACNNVKRVLTICNKKEIPVYRGSSRPLVKEYLKRDTAYHSFDGLGTVAQEFSTGDIPESEVPAAVALIELSKKHQGEITLIPLGPLTNIALAHRIDPDFTRRLKSIVCMGGNYKGIGNHTETAEFNFFCDPYSADIVMGGALCPVKLVPWETCLEHGIPFSTYESLKQVATVKGHFYNRISCKMIGRHKKGAETSVPTATCSLWLRPSIQSASRKLSRVRWLWKPAELIQRDL